MYFKDRVEAGAKLAKLLAKFANDDCAIVAMSPGAVVVGMELAESLHASLMMLLTEEIDIPGEPTPLAAVTSDNIFTYNPMYSLGEIEEFTMDYFNVIQQERMKELHKLHIILGKNGEIKKEKIRNHTVVLLSDGLNNGFSINVAMDYLKTISIKKLVVVSVFATYEAYDKMKLAGDEYYCLNLVDNFMGVDHYYDDNKIPPIDKLLAISEDISKLWSKS